eukprot:9827706-Alexandrium_andersonii.AAC.1
MPCCARGVPARAGEDGRRGAWRPYEGMARQKQTSFPSSREKSRAYVKHDGGEQSLDSSPEGMRP